MSEVTVGDVPVLLEEIRDRLVVLEGETATIKADVAIIKADVKVVKNDVATIKAVLPVDQEAQNIATVRRVAGRQRSEAIPRAAAGKGHLEPY
jgi:uncharacterized protein (UPF0335 family)